MGNFNITAIEHYSRIHMVEADTLDEAINIIASQYEEGEIPILTDDGFDGMDFIATPKGYRYYLNCVCEYKEQD